MENGDGLNSVRAFLGVSEPRTTVALVIGAKHVNDDSAAPPGWPTPLALRLQLAMSSDLNRPWKLKARLVLERGVRGLQAIQVSCAHHRKRQATIAWGHVAPDRMVHRPSPRRPAGPGGDTVAPAALAGRERRAGRQQGECGSDPHTQHLQQRPPECIAAALPAPDACEFIPRRSLLSTGGGQRSFEV